MSDTSRPIELPRSDQALHVCQDHAERAKPLHKYWDWYQIEAVLVGYVASTIYAELEAKVVEIVADAVRSKESVRVHAFGEYASKRIIRSIKIEQLSGFLGFFDSCCKDHFKASLKPKQTSDWDSLVAIRHGVAHESESQQVSSLNDIAQYYSNAQDVLLLFKESLNVSCPHIS